MNIILNVIIIIVIIIILFRNENNKLVKKKFLIDAFIYFQESQMLSVRLFRMNSFVDFFLIIVSNTTFSGLKQNISFSNYEWFIKYYKKKIILYYISHPSNCSRTWCREKYQRNSISKAVKSLNLNKESIVIISDVDEIPTANAMKYILKNPPGELYVLSGYLYYYNYRHKMNIKWSGVIVLKAANCVNIQKYRDKRNFLGNKNPIPVYPSITHCSYCYEKISSIQNKLYSFSHTEFNKPPYTNIKYIKNCIKKHKNIFPNNITITLVEYDSKLLPLPNDERFNNLKLAYGFK